MTSSYAVEDAPARSGYLLPLVGVALALAFWSGAENTRDRVEGMNQQLLSSMRQTTTGAGDKLAKARRGSAALLEERLEVEKSLQTSETLEMLQTRFLYVLRQRCQAAGVQSCTVKFASEANRAQGTASASSPTAARPLAKAALADRPAAEIGIDDLGLAKARATVGGIFQSREMVDLVNALGKDDVRVWRINGLVVRGNTFELDVEQVVKLPATGGGGP